MQDGREFMERDILVGPSRRFSNVSALPACGVSP
jgi:hypothetical protein